MNRLPPGIVPLCCIALAVVWVNAQGGSYKAGQTFSVVGSLPGSCTPPDIVILTTDATLRVCTATNTWNNLHSEGGLVTVPMGGTGLATLTAHALYVGNGASVPTALAVCGTGTYVRGAAGADPICSTLTLPNTATQGDLMVATGASAEGAITAVAAGSYLRSNGTSVVPVYSTTTLPNTTATGNFLVATATNAVAAVTPALTMATPADQTGNATATLKMNGLGAAAAPCTVTPVATGRVHFLLTGQIKQSTTADGVVTKIAYGTGAAPANAAAAAGTIIGATDTWTALTGMLTVPWAMSAIATGLALSTAVWYDVQIADVTGGTASLTNVTCVAREL